ncbi:hypothetical protein IL306_010181 [Fusarium sp. DS 682]|nr:hypothetical protein IL306_010181 [Fusarium sp. DS 682]
MSITNPEKDLLTGDEMISDSYPIKEVGGAVYEVDCSLVKEGNVTVDIGANASAEEAEEALDDTQATVNNVVYSFRLQSTTFDKRTFVIYLKGYMKSVKSRLQELGKDAEYIDEFEKNAQAYVKSTILPNFKDYEFYTGESQDSGGMLVR